ncbi:16S rRNA-processing protein RimM [Advenella kashmirensis WT001]|uniref:Ribosome maturation factor RimM n=1 Tax=Advenella kashmirensis (strain DSM 17095 / LMG 22695 / WT001) TaxID=1036672 RepID=I3UBN9_ADVKW|nr:ribosome maturation factor RimM [Advenella kashmirensis]AFK62427.1 16S rRNA-processing protein RimM [Advenella kashmirensis WT001]
MSTLPEDLVELGRIVSAYGVKGMVKIQPYSDERSALLDIDQWWLARVSPRNGALLSAHTPVRAQRVREQGSDLVAALEGVADRDQAEAMKGTSIFASRSLFPSAPDDEYYWVDLIGSRVYLEDDGQLAGIVLEVMDNGAHGVLRVARHQADAQGEPTPLLDAKGRVQEWLVPFVNEHVPQVDVAARRIVTRFPLDF